MSKAAVQRCSCKVGKIIEKYFLRSSFWVKLQAECCNFTKSEPLHRYFSRILATFLEIIAIFYFSLSLFISPYTSISTAMSPLALHYFEHNFHSYLSLSLFISKWEPTLRSIKLQVLSYFSNSFISWYQNVNKKYVQLNKAHKFFAVRIFKFKYWNVRQIGQNSTPSTQSPKKIKHFIKSSTQAPQARKYDKHAST